MVYRAAPWALDKQAFDLSFRQETAALTAPYLAVLHNCTLVTCPIR